jgi:hypothetical protein
MSKFTFVYQNVNMHSKELISKITSETNADSLKEVLEEFESFLKGAGYYFDGRIDIVKEDDDYDFDDEDDDENSDAFFDDEDEKFESPSSVTWPFPTEKGPG